MLQDMEQIEYKYGVLDNSTRPVELHARTWRGKQIPAEIRKAINEEDLLNLGGIFGDRDAGDPVEYDHLKLVLTYDSDEITVFNRGITLFTADDDRVQRIHRVLCKLDKHGG